MKKQEVKELAKLDLKALRSRLNELRKGYLEQVNKSFKKTEKNLHLGYVIKKDIARVLTFMKQKELGL